MKKKNKVTIVIPTFNRAKFVCHTIDSALAQTVPCDIIVCDHGSSDNTPKVMKKYGDKITYIRREKDFGPHFCWLEGVLNAETDLIHIHFDDDLLKPTFIEETLKYMADDIGMVFTDAEIFNNDTNQVITPYCFNFKKYFETGVLDTKLLEQKLLDGWMFSPAICLYHRQDIIDALLPGNLPIDFGGSYHGVGPDLLMSLLACIRYAKCAVVTKSLSVFGAHAGSITKDSETDKEKSKQLHAAYNAFRSYYRLIKLFKENTQIRSLILSKEKKKWNKRLKRKIKQILKALGLRKKEVK